MGQIMHMEYGNKNYVALAIQINTKKQTKQKQNQNKTKKNVSGESKPNKQKRAFSIHIVRICADKSKQSLTVMQNL